jgi:hypothetical protein
VPTFKHPCPHCGTYIQRDAAACPKCGARDPFAPARCANCRTVIEDPSYVACPRCGKPVGAAAVAAAEAEANAKAGAGSQGTAPATQPTENGAIPGWGQPPAAVPHIDEPAPGATSCGACGSPLAAGASFCRECGTAVSPA